MVQFSHLYMTSGKTIALTIWTFVSKMMSLLVKMLSRFVIVFLPRSKCLLISWLQSLSTAILDLNKGGCSWNEMCKWKIRISVSNVLKHKFNVLTICICFHSWSLLWVLYNSSKAFCESKNRRQSPEATGLSANGFRLKWNAFLLSIEGMLPHDWMHYE